MNSKLPIISALIFLSFQGFSQVFPNQEGIWQTSEITIVGPVKNFYHLCGDTLIDGQNYQKHYRLNFTQEGELLSKSYQGATRVEGDSAWWIIPGRRNEILLYDFNLEEEEEITLIDFVLTSVTLKVDSVRMINLSGIDRRIIYFAPLNEFTPFEFWIEGMGSNKGPLTRAYLPSIDWDPTTVCFEGVGLTYQTDIDFLSCTLEGNNYCSITSDVPEPKEKEHFLITYPNPCKTFLYFDLEIPPFKSGLFTGELLDLQGRVAKNISFDEVKRQKLWLGDLPSGLYFLNVKLERSILYC